MRLLIYCLILTLCACGDSMWRNKPYTPADNSKKVAGTTEATITVQPVSMYNELYTLGITKYRRSDTLKAVQILLEKNKHAIYNEYIDISSFSLLANKTSFRSVVLVDISYSSVRNNRLYFTAFLNSLSTGKVSELEFELFDLPAFMHLMEYWLDNHTTNQLSVRHIYGAIGNMIQYVVTDTSVAVNTDCDYSDCYERVAYRRKLSASEARQFFKHLQSLSLDTLQASYDSGWQDGHLAEFAFGGPDIPLKFVSLNNVDLPAITEINNAIDELIKAKKYRFAHIFE